MQSSLYQKLQEDDSIRILVLQPGSRGSPISCTLEETRLSLKPRYNALSYAWGAPILNHSIKINDRPVKVRHNLYTALQYIRDTNVPRSVWIDALTINQEGILERNQQLLLMGQIYRNAYVTLVWLREETDGDKLALDLFHLCDAIVNDDAIPMQEKYLEISDSMFRYDETTSAKLITSLYGILSSTWFRRTWVILEFALSPRVVMLCGHNTIGPAGLSLLRDTWQNSKDARLTWGELREPMSQVAVLTFMRQSALEESGAQLGSLLLLTNGRFEATEPHDSDFALFSLVKIPGRVLKADYNMTIAQVYTNAARLSAETGMLFFMLGQSCRHPASGSKHALPSWVPDFHHRDQARPMMQLYDYIYSAGGHEAPTMDFSDDGLVIMLKGRILDVVDTLLRDPSEEHSDWNLYQEWYAKCEEFAKANGDYPSGECFPEAWWRLVICDIHVSSHNVTSAASSGFGSLYLDPVISANQILSMEEIGESLRTKQFEYRISARTLSATKSFCRTVKRYLGWTSPLAKPDDKICLLAGSASPWVIRSKSDGTFQLICEAYIHGIMYGETLDWKGTQWEDIRLS